MDFALCLALVVGVSVWLVILMRNVHSAFKLHLSLRAEPAGSVAAA
jgi:hypothetical protein